MASSLQDACNDLSLNDSLRAILECPVCFNVCHTPIYMCSNGHHICNTCQSSLTTCPTCREEGQPDIRCITLEKVADKVRIRACANKRERCDTTTVHNTCGVDGQPAARCLPMEKMADKVRMPCANKREGCETVLNATDMAKHWETCKAKYTYGCRVLSLVSARFTSCGWEGDRGALVAHVKEKHSGNYSEDDVIQCDVAISFTQNVYYRRLVSAHGELFWVRLWYSIDPIRAYIFSCYIGKRENAANYRGRFVYSSKDGRTENNCILKTADLYISFDAQSYPSKYALRLLKSTLEEYMVEDIFSFKAQILKR